MIRRIIVKYQSMPVQIRASLWFLVCSFLQKGISMISTPVFTRLLTTSEYGKFSVFNSWYGIVTIIVSMNMYLGVYTQGLVKFDQERRTFSSSLQGFTLVLVVVWTGVYFLFRPFWNRLLSLSTIQVLAMLLMTWSTAAFNFWASEQRVYYKYCSLVAVTVIVSFLKPVVGVFLVIHAEDKVTARILGLALVEIVGYTGCFVSQVLRGKQLYSYKFWKYAFFYNLPLIPHYLSQTVLNNMDRIMIKNIVGDSEAGIYSLAYSIAMIMTLFNTAMLQTLNPWMYQKIKNNKIEDIAPIAYLSLIVVFVANMVLMALGPEVVKVFAPSTYYEAMYCIPPIAMGVLFLYTYDLFAKFAFYYEKTVLIMMASVGGAILNIILNYYGIKIFGYIAAAYTTLVCYICYAVFHYILMTRICNQYCLGRKPYSIRILISFAGAFLICGFGMLALYDYSFLRFIIIGGIAIGIIHERNTIKRILLQFQLVRKKDI